MDDRQDSLASPSPPGGSTITVECDHALTDGGLRVTEIRIALRGEDKLKAFVSVTLERSLVIRGIKIIEGRQRLFVAMPSRSKTDGSFQDIVHPINQETRARLESCVLETYYDVAETREIN